MNKYLNINSLSSILFNLVFFRYFWKLCSVYELFHLLVIILLLDKDEQIHRFLLELTATHDLKWTTFLADLGYSAKDLLHVPQGKKDDIFFHYLKLWLETVTSLGQNPVQYLYRALMKSHHKDLINEFELQFPCGKETY